MDSIKLRYWTPKVLALRHQAPSTSRTTDLHSLMTSTVPVRNLILTHDCTRSQPRLQAPNQKKKTIKHFPSDAYEVHERKRLQYSTAHIPGMVSRCTMWFATRFNL